MAPDSDASIRKGLVVLAALLAILAGVGYGVFLLLDALPSGVAAAVATASATAVVSVLSLVYSRRSEQTRAIQEAQRDHKRRVYEEFMQFWFRVLFSKQLGEEPPGEQELTRFMVDFNRQLILWGSDQLLQNYNSFRAVSLAAQAAGDFEATDEARPGAVRAILAFERVLYEIRRDIGHSNKGLGTGDLLRTFVPDIDTHLAATAIAATPQPSKP